MELVSDKLLLPMTLNAIAPPSTLRMTITWSSVKEWIAIARIANNVCFREMSIDRGFPFFA
jgi:hypothetical protein